MEPDFFPFTADTRVSIDPGTVFRVYYMEAPLSFLGKKLGLGLGSNLVELHGYHSGVGFQSTDPKRPLEFYLDYLSSGLSFYTLLPTIVTSPNGNKSLIWNNHGQVSIGKDINRNYWEVSNFVCTITGQNLIDLQNYILSKFIPRNPRYVYTNIIQGVTRQSIFNPIARSSTCDDFCAAVFSYFQNNLNICIDYVTPNFETVFAIVVASNRDVKVVDYEDPTVRQDIVRYYENIEFLFSNLLPGEFQEIINSLIDEVTNNDNIDTASAIKSIRTDHFTMNYLLFQMIKDLPYIYTYGYSYDGNTLVYYKVKPESLYVNYIESDLKRNVVAMNILAQPVQDDYTIDPGHIDHGFMGCQSPVDGVSNCYVMSSSQITNILSIILVVIVIILIAVFFILYYRKL